MDWRTVRASEERRMRMGVFEFRNTIEIHDKTEAFLREQLEERFSEMYEEQVSLFKKMYPEPIAPERLFNAIDTCDRTIRKNFNRPPKEKP
jgi:hypothetical protein